MLALAKAMVSIVLGGLTWSLAEYGLHNWLGHHGGGQKSLFEGAPSPPCAIALLCARVAKSAGGDYCDCTACTGGDTRE